MTDDDLTYQIDLPDPDRLTEFSDPVQHYICHVHYGLTFTKIAAAYHSHPSTILRHVRQIEDARDDPLLDQALADLDDPLPPKDVLPMPSIPNAHASKQALKSPPNSDGEARRILRRLCEKDAVLVVVQDMDRAVVLRPNLEGGQTRTAVMDRSHAQSFVLKDWICATRKGRVASYRITPTGRLALKRLIEEDRRRRKSDGDLGQGPNVFAAQHGDYGIKRENFANGSHAQMRVNLNESPLSGLARRKGADGKPFLSAPLVQAAERLREDFERAQLGPRVAQNWDRFLTSADRGVFGDGGIGEGPAAARKRVLDAMDHLGPGLSDVVMRVCCFLEGMEPAERRLGWSARSGKVVLKIGLQRLLEFYQTHHGLVPAMIE